MIYINSCANHSAKAVIERPACKKIVFLAENDRIFLDRDSALNLIECQKKQAAYLNYLEGLLK